ncbi:hypothetical protein [Plastoroseomonas hellenica]|uniref:Uncharacterized protein n=1 Tax=Plastoroseomonas hellenica TaxID=2687306 RepID=A0ABS5F1C5_9PROT|nr:hypothetical protein [Plastoroseomonas hellenica]MBR0643717.1 hypothetical protein [Plastoroseomonas hellenica]MBR0666326.1 hypothetical protein [Plastoroseomonas hellenica]
MPEPIIPKDSEATIERPPEAPRPPVEPWTGRALWPTFMRRTLPADLLNDPKLTDRMQ